MKKDIHLTQLFGESWDIFKKNWGSILLTIFIFGFISWVVSFVQNMFQTQEGSLLETGLALVSYVISLWLGMGFIKFTLNLVDDKESSYRDLFSGVESFKHIGKYFLITVIAGLLTFVGYLLLVIPGIILTFGLYFVAFVAYENKNTIGGALSYAWKLTRGYKWKIFLFMLLSILVGLLGLLALGVGLFVAIPVMALANALFYRKLQGLQDNEVLESEEEETPLVEEEKEDGEESSFEEAEVLSEEK